LKRKKEEIALSEPPPPKKIQIYKYFLHITENTIWLHPLKRGFNPLKIFSIKKSTQNGGLALTQLFF
jgi:hypothetical protein